MAEATHLVWLARRNECEKDSPKFSSLFKARLQPYSDGDNFSNPVLKSVRTAGVFRLSSE